MSEVLPEMIRYALILMADKISHSFLVRFRASDGNLKSELFLD
jgi:hypothetical protein